MSAAPDLGPESGMLARLAASPAGRAATLVLRWGIPLALLVLIGRRLTALGWGGIWQARPSNAGFYLLLVAQFFLQPFGDYFVYRNLWGRACTPPMAVILRKRLMNTFMLDYSGEAYFFFWAQRNVPLAVNRIAHGIKDSNLLSGGAGLAMVWILGAMLLACGGLHLPVLPGSRWLYVLIGTVPLVLCAVLVAAHRKVTVLSLRQLGIVFAIHFSRACLVLGIEFGLWQLSGAMSSWIMSLQFVALRLVITRLPVVPNKDLIFVGAGLAAAGAAHAAVTPVATVLVILAAADLILAAGVAGLTALPGMMRGAVMTRAWVRSPMFWILLAAAGLRLFGLFWGLPGADGWDDDGFAPRNFLTALALTWKPGAFFTYPPLQALLLALPALPVAGWALAHAPSLHQHDVIATITQPGYMTYFSVVARLVAIAMSLGIIWTIGAMARLIAGPRAGLLAAGAAALNFGLIYYGQVSNLDVPYLFWACLALLFAMQAVTLQQPRRFWWAAFCAAAAIATKDQAYAIFLLGLPAFLALWFATDAWPRAHARAVLTTLALAAAAAIAALLLVDGAVTNLSGFLRRVAFLTGPASADYAEYVHGPAGWWALLRDMSVYYLRGFGLTAVTLAALGVFLAVKKRGSLAVALLPLLAAISFTICFNFAALRSDVRFALPQAVLACVYIGITAQVLVFPAKPRLRWVGRAALAAVALMSLHQAMAIDAAMIFDPRYDAADWLAQNARPGDGIEVYDRNWLLPHFPAGVNVWRVGQGDVRGRNPLPGVTEIQQPFAVVALRHPRFILVSANWMQRYLPVAAPPPGRIASPNQQADMNDRDTRLFFAALAQGQLGYRPAHIARYRGLWPPVHIHDSLDEPLGLYERQP